MFLNTHLLQSTEDGSVSQRKTLGEIRTGSQEAASRDRGSGAAFPQNPGDT